MPYFLKIKRLDNMLKIRILYINFFLFIMFFFNGCLSIAKISDFPLENKPIDFDKQSVRNYDNGSLKWTFKTGSEFYFEIKQIDEIELVNYMKMGIQSVNYKIKIIDTLNNVIIAKRGLRANEWKSIFGIYYKENSDCYQIYIKNKVTQDITGGFNFNRAKELADQICIFSNKCIE